MYFCSRTFFRDRLFESNFLLILVSDPNFADISFALTFKKCDYLQNRGHLDTFWCLLRTIPFFPKCRTRPSKGGRIVALAHLVCKSYSAETFSIQQALLQF